MNTTGRTRYLNLSGQSSVLAYRCDTDRITVQY